jgi:hypothetical protein
MKSMAHFTYLRGPLWRWELKKQIPKPISAKKKDEDTEKAVDKEGWVDTYLKMPN